MRILGDDNHTIVHQCRYVRRETYAEPWLPEPVDASDDPRLGAEREEARKLAVLVLLSGANQAVSALYAKLARPLFAGSYAKLLISRLRT